MTCAPNSLPMRVADVFGDRLAVSITNRCPIQCEHCISKSSPYTHRGKEGLSKAVSELLSSDEKYRHITLTGGEPFDDLAVLREFADVCNSRGIKYGAITSAFWAKTKNSAQKAIASVPGIFSLTVSTDIYHAKFIRPGFIRNAYYSARNAGARTRVRLTRNAECKESDKLKDAILDFLPEEDLEICSLAPYGRAEGKNISEARDPSPYYGRCPTSGAHIFEDGRITPCCNSIVSLRSHAFFNYGNIVDDMPSAIGRMQSDVLFLIVKKIGFDFIDIFAKQHGVEIKRFANSCDFCFHMNKGGDLSNIVLDLLESGMDMAGLVYLHATSEVEEERASLEAMMSNLAREKLLHREYRLI